MFCELFLGVSDIVLLLSFFGFPFMLNSFSILCSNMIHNFLTKGNAAGEESGIKVSVEILVIGFLCVVSGVNILVFVGMKIVDYYIKCGGM